jgi:hypothetical protein
MVINFQSGPPLAVMGLGLVSVLFGQSGGRFEETKRLALAYLDSNQYDRAAGKLEEIWQEDQSDASVAENLVIAYLNGLERLTHPEVEEKARELLHSALRAGGSATFLVQHSHGRFGFMDGKVITDYCGGRLSIGRGRLIYVAQARKGIEAHSFDLNADEIRVKGPDGAGTFTIKSKDKNYVMVPRSRIKPDAGLIMSILKKFVPGQR